SRALTPVYFEFVDLVPTTNAHKLLPPSTSGAAPRDRAASLTLDQWVQVLDPEKLGNAELRRPESVLGELRRRRLDKPPLLVPSQTARARQRADALLQNGFELRNNPSIRIGELI